MESLTETSRPQDAAQPIAAFLDMLGCGLSRCALRERAADRVVCDTCGRDLRLAGTMVTDSKAATVTNSLEEIDYDTRHGVSVEASRHFGECWLRMVREAVPLVPLPDILEIGAGTGLLTLGLVMSGGFNRLIVSDISAKLLAVAQARVAAHAPNPAALAERLRYLVCTIDDLPLRRDCVDAVLANSVLHHIYDYELALTRIRRILRPGGVAIFSEPVIQGKAFVGFLSALIRKLDDQAAQPAFSSEDRRKMGDLATLCTREFWDTTAHLVKDSADDKHLFDIGHLRQVALALGFSAVEALPYDKITDGFRQAVEDSLRIMQIEPAPLERYGDIFTAFQRHVIEQVPASVCTPHAFIVIHN